MIVYSENFVFPSAQAQLGLNNPLVGWHNIVTGTNISSTTEQEGSPASNLATPMTYHRWYGLNTVGYQYITVLNSPNEDLDYLAVAGHNFSTGGFAVSVEGALTINSDGDFDWETISPEVILPDDGPLLVRFTSAPYLAVRLAILGPGASDTDPYAAVMYVGRLLVLPRRIYVGHAPMTLNTKTEALTGFSETGEFLGRVIRRQSTPGSIDMHNINPAFYRTYMKPWITAAQTLPFFFAWRPFTYSTEVAFCWGMDDGRVSNESSNGFMQLSLTLQGHVG